MQAVYYLFLHLVADFFLQSREMGRKKSTNSYWLSRHIMIIYLVFLIGTLDWKFALTNALIHAVIDASIWKLYAFSAWKRRKTVGSNVFPSTKRDDKNVMKREWRYWEDHWFYTTVGIDQFLHGATILLLLEYL